MDDSNPGHPRYQIGRAISRFTDATGGGAGALADALDDLITVAWPFLEHDVREVKYAIPEPDQRKYGGGREFDEYAYARDLKRIARRVLDRLHEKKLYGWKENEYGAGGEDLALKALSEDDDAGALP